MVGKGHNIKDHSQVTLVGQFLLLYMKSGVDETTNRVAREVRKTSHKSLLHVRRFQLLIIPEYSRPKHEGVTIKITSGSDN